MNPLRLGLGTDLHRLLATRSGPSGPRHRHDVRDDSRCYSWFVVENEKTALSLERGLLKRLTRLPAARETWVSSLMTEGHTTGW